MSEQKIKELAGRELEFWSEHSCGTIDIESFDVEWNEDEEEFFCLTIELSDRSNGIDDRICLHCKVKDDSVMVDVTDTSCYVHRIYEVITPMLRVQLASRFAAMGKEVDRLRTRVASLEEINGQLEEQRNHEHVARHTAEGILRSFVEAMDHSDVDLFDMATETLDRARGYFAKLEPATLDRIDKEKE